MAHPTGVADFSDRQATLRLRHRLCIEQALDFLSSAGVDARGMDQQAEVTVLNRLQVENIEIEVADNRMVQQLMTFREVDDIMARPEFPKFGTDFTQLGDHFCPPRIIDET